MTTDKLESSIYNYSINIIGFMMTLKKANLNNALTSDIVKNAGALNTYFMDAIELEGQELRMQIGKCIKITDDLQALFSKLDLHGKFENDKVNLQIETAEILKNLELLIMESEISST